MFDNLLTIEERDLERHMNDNASRVEMSSLMQKRFANMQKLLLKAQTLSDRDFETAFSSLESIVESLKKKSLKQEPTEKTTNNKLSQLIATK